jgi:hypothetical protein
MRALLIGMVATGSVAHAQEASIELSAEDSLWLEAKSSDSTQAYQSYLEAYPVGRFASEAFRRLVERSRIGQTTSPDDFPEPAAGAPSAMAGALALADLY